MTASAFSSSSPLLLQTGGTTRIYVDDTNGNVGIGTTSPSAKFEISGMLKATALSGSWDNSVNNYVRIGNLQIAYGSGNTDINGILVVFPANFIEAPNVTATLTSGSGTKSLFVLNTTTTGTTVVSNTTETLSFNWQAVGRWQ